MAKFEESSMTLGGLPVRHITVDGELYLAVKQSDIDDLVYIQHVVIKRMLETQHNVANLS